MNFMPEVKEKQNLLLCDRAHLEVNAVRDVVSFDDRTVLLSTAYGNMTVEGEALHITRLDLEKGEMALDGNISAVYYSEQKSAEKGGFFSRILR